MKRGLKLGVFFCALTSLPISASMAGPITVAPGPPTVVPPATATATATSTSIGTPPARPVAADPLGHWTTTSLDVGSGGWASGFTFPVASLNGTFFASGAVQGQNRTNINTSTDGVRWTPGSLITLPGPAVLPYQMPQLAFGYAAGVYVTGFGNGAIETSKDGVSWSWVNSTTNQGLTSAVCATVSSPSSSGLRVVHPVCLFGSNGFVVTSADDAMQTWKLVGLPDQRYGVAGLTYGNGLFVAVTQTGCSGCGPSLETGAIFTSPDGTTWTQRATTQGMFAVTYGVRGFVAVGWLGTIMTSTDGITWTSTQVSASNASAIQFHGVAYGDGDYVAAGFIQGSQMTPILYTTGGRSATWTQRTVGVSNAMLYGATFGNDRFVVAGFATGAGNAGHLVLTSDDVKGS
jgi:hypothetical protein